MKKLCCVLLVLLMILAASGCEQEDPVVTVEKNGITFTVNKENFTISDGTNVYHYNSVRVSTTVGSSTNIRIHYPNGSSYFESTKTNNGITTGNSGWSDDYDEDRYLPGAVLVDVVEQVAQIQAPRGVTWYLVLVAAVVIVFGALNIAFPCFWWQLRYGLYVRDAEPTEFAILMSRIGGGVCITIGVIMGIIGFMGGTL